jgi:hypothetical protein
VSRLIQPNITPMLAAGEAIVGRHAATRKHIPVLQGHWGPLVSCPATPHSSLNVVRKPLRDAYVLAM